MKKLSLKFLFIIATLAIGFSSCNDDDDYVYPSRPDGLRYPNSVEVERADAYKTIKGFYLLNQGKQGDNNSTLSFYDAPTGDFYKDIFTFFNPSVTHGLGDVGNDIQINNGKAYIVMNVSNLIVVLDTKTNKQISTIPILSPRNIAFSADGKYAYVTTASNLAGSIGQDSEKNGALAKINLSSNKVEEYLPMSYGPEGLVVRDNKIYVANSQYYNGTTYQSTYSNKVIVVDIANGAFEIKKELETAINLTKMIYDTTSGNIYVISSGDYSPTNPAKIIVIDKLDKISTIDRPASSMASNNGVLYVCATQYLGDKYILTVSYSKINTTTNAVIADSFIDSKYQSEIVVPYSIAINPETHDIYITDSTSTGAPGSIYCFGSGGNYKWSAITGLFPGAIAFTNNVLTGLEPLITQ